MNQAVGVRGWVPGWPVHRCRCSSGQGPGDPGAGVDEWGDTGQGVRSVGDRRTVQCLETFSLQAAPKVSPQHWPLPPPTRHNLPLPSHPRFLSSCRQGVSSRSSHPHWRCGEAVLARGGGNVFIIGNERHDCTVISQRRFPSSTGSRGLPGPWNSIWYASACQLMGCCWMPRDPPFPGTLNDAEKWPRFIYWGGACSCLWVCGEMTSWENRSLWARWEGLGFSSCPGAWADSPGSPHWPHCWGVPLTGAVTPPWGVTHCPMMPSISSPPVEFFHLIAIPSLTSPSFPHSFPEHPTYYVLSYVLGAPRAAKALSSWMEGRWH